MIVRLRRVLACTAAWLSASAGAYDALRAQPAATRRLPVTDAMRPFVSVDAPLVALIDVTVIDGTGAPSAAHQTVLVRDGRIVAVGPVGVVAVPPRALRLERPGHTLIPGLVGLHEHSYFGGVKRITQMSTSGPLLYLAHGVTTAMSAGSMLPYQERAMKQAIDAGRLPGPDYLITGPYLDGAATVSINARPLTSAAEARRVIAYWAAEGATWVKVQGRISRAMLREVIQAAHARGLKVTGHLCSVTFAEAADAGIDALQHGFITASDYVPGKQPDVCPPENMRIQSTIDAGSPAVQASIRRLAKSGTPVVSTLAVYESFSRERFRLDTAAMAMLDPDVRREVEANHAALGTDGGLTVSPALLTNMMRWEYDFVQAGGLLGAGSDPWGTGFLPGFGNLRNFEMLREAGFSAEAAIRILTLNGARILGRAQEIGAITPGRRADLVLVEGNPAVNPQDLYRVVTVFRAGVGFDAKRLRDAARGLVGVR
ncbi:MAG: amidohydrolase family protein [Gemmatimonadota bacterium]|nr:amidohydrolase family protein [Gemmatimonadota bacterium]